MRLRDAIYLRFFLFHQRYGKLWAALIEGVCVFVAAAVIGVFLFFLANLTIKAVDEMVEQRASVYKKEAKAYQNTLLACLNGGVIGKAGDEVIACDPAVTFKFRRLR